MNKFTSDDRIHEGHRARMRAKLLMHGAKIFDTYELLEMLLYYVIPYKDTNPLAKRLLEGFGTLDGVLSAKRDEMLGVPGIGERAADFISSIDRLNSLIGAEFAFDNIPSFNDYDAVGGYFSKYFAEYPQSQFAVMMLDNSMHLVDMRRFETPYNSASTSSKLFIDMAIRSDASVIITAQNKYYGSLFPSLSDRETTKMITAALGAINIMHIEHYIISGESYSGIVNRMPVGFAQSPEIEDFIAGKKKALSALAVCEEGEIPRDEA